MLRRLSRVPRLDIVVGHLGPVSLLLKYVLLRLLNLDRFLKCLVERRRRLMNLLVTFLHLHG